MNKPTLLEACRFADACGLTTIGEAMMNVELHYDVFFSIDNLEAEERAFYEDVARYNVTDDTLIEDIFTRGELD